MGRCPPEITTATRDKFNPDYFAQLQQHPGFFAFVAEVDDKVVGFVRGKIAPNYGYAAEIVSLHISMQYQKQGVGKQLLQKTFEYLKTNHCESVFLWCAPNNTNAVKFYLYQNGTQHPEIHMEISGILHTLFAWKFC